MNAQELATQELIDELRDRMAGMKQRDRETVLDSIRDGYCVNCGAELLGGRCDCRDGE